MSSKTGTRLTARKPASTRRHESLTPGEFGYGTPDSVRAAEELNRNISGKRSKQHAKYKRSVAGTGKKSLGEKPGQSERDRKGRKGQYTGAGDSALTKK